MSAPAEATPTKETVRFTLPPVTNDAEDGEQARNASSSALSPTSRSSFNMAEGLSPTGNRTDLGIKKSSSCSSHTSRLSAASYISFDPTGEEEPHGAAMVLLGISVLLPWNVILTIPDYFAALFGPLFLSRCTALFQVPNLTFLILQSVIINQYVTGRAKIFVSYSIFVTCFALMLVMNFSWDPHGAGPEWQQNLWFLVIVLLAVAASLLQGSLFGVFARVGGKHVGRLMQGLGLAGLTVGTFRCIFKASIGSEPEQLRVQAMGFFFFGMIGVIAAAMTFSRVIKIPTVREASLATEPPGAAAGAISVVRKMMPAPFAILFIFVVTLNQFPAVVVQIQPSTSMEKDWFTLMLTMVYLLGDFVGRYMVSFRCAVLSSRIAAIGAIARGSFFFLIPCRAYMWLAFGPMGVTQDIWAIFLVAALSLSNGYIATMAMISAGKDIPDDQKAHAGLAMTTCLVTGLSIGTSTGLLWPSSKPLHPAITTTAAPAGVMMPFVLFA